LADIATACWEAVDDAFPGEPAILIGCSAGSQIAPTMYHLRPDRTTALILSGTGYLPEGGQPTDRARSQRLAGRIKGFEREGLSYRWRYTFEDFSPAFRATPLARYLADLFCERNVYADADSIIYQLKSLTEERGAQFYHAIRCPTLVLTGTEDNAHSRALLIKDEIPGCELGILPGAGHASHLEQPWLFDELVLRFLTSRGLVKPA
jgi:pimeloyl-ACP methyl ester carboxylesterase